MPESRWFTGRDQSRGTVLFQTDRTVRIWQQTVSGSELLLRAIDDDHPTRLDLLFTKVEKQHLRRSYDGLTVRSPTAAEAAGFGTGTTFILESGEIRDYVSARHFGWQEEERTNFGPDSPLAMMIPLAAAPPWLEGGPDFTGYAPSGPAIPIGDLVDAVVAGEPSAAEGFRYVYVVVVRISRPLPDGRENQKVAPVAVYLTRGDAEAAIRAELAAKAATITRAGQPGAAVQDELVATTVAETELERWVVTVPVQL
jgi:hypothetical protein